MAAELVSRVPSREQLWPRSLSLSERASRARAIGLLFAFALACAAAGALTLGLLFTLAFGLVFATAGLAFATASVFVLVAGLALATGSAVAFAVGLAFAAGFGNGLSLIGDGLRLNDGLWPC